LRRIRGRRDAQILAGALQRPDSQGFDSRIPAIFYFPADKMPVFFGLRAMLFIAAVLSGLLMPVFASAEELFRYRFRTKDGRQFQYVFESSAQPVPRSITKDEATRIAANWMTTFYHLQPGSLEYTEFYEKPLPHWLVCFADTVSGPIQHLLFAVVLPDGKIVQPSFSERF
jgi:hypothetical protein